MSLTTSDIQTVARAVVTALAANNLRCCLVGGAACSLYGITRCPNVSPIGNRDHNYFSTTDVKCIGRRHGCLDTGAILRGYQSGACSRKLEIFSRSIQKPSKLLSRTMVQLINSILFVVIHFFLPLLHIPRTKMQSRYSNPRNTQHPINPIQQNQIHKRPSRLTHHRPPVPETPRLDRPLCVHKV